MKKLYILLDNELRMCITVDRCIIFYKEYEYTESILDQLYSKISAHQVDAAVVVTKGILSEQFFGESYNVFNFSIKDSEHSCYVSKFDVNKIVNLLNTSGVESVRVFDKFGYYVSLAKHDCCMVDTLGNAYSVITFRDKIRDISYNSYQNLEKILINCNKKFAINEFIDMTTYYDDRYVRYFKNISTILEQLKKAIESEDGDNSKKLIRVLATLSTFAYTELKIAHFFELKQDRITLVNANPIRKEDDYETVEDLAEEQPEQEIKQNVEDSKPEKRASAEHKEKKPKKEKKRKKEKKPASKALKIANVACILISATMLGATYYCSNAATKYTEQIGAISSQNDELLGQIDTDNIKLSEYQGFISNLSALDDYATLYGSLTKTSYNSGIKEVSYEDGVLKTKIYVKDTTKVNNDESKTENNESKTESDENTKSSKVDTKMDVALKIKKDLGKKFAVPQIVEEKSNKDGYLLFSVDLAKK